MAGFHSFLWLSSIPLYVYTHTIRNNAAMDMRVHVFELVFSCSVDKYPGVEQLGHMVSLFLIF